MNNQNKTGQKHFFSKSISAEKVTGQLLVASRLYESMLEGVFITDTNGIIRFINPSFTRISGYAEEVIGQNPRILQSGKHDIVFYKNMWKSIEQNGQWIGEIWNKRKDGSLLIQHMTITKIKDDFGKTLYYAAVLTDITKRKEMEQKLNNDLLLAKEVQKSALSQSIHNDDIQIEGVFLPSELVGGDMYAWYQINEHTYGIFLMDVMGHGVASALVSMSVQSLLRGIIDSYVDPATVLKELNHHVYSLFRKKDSIGMKNYFLTCVYAVVDLNNNELTFASAGHPPMIIIQNDGNPIELDNGTVPLGLLAGVNDTNSII